MELDDAIARRRMVRAFDRRPLADGLLDDLLDKARRAPSAGNSQAVRFLVLDRPEETDRYWAVTLPPPKRDAFRWQQLLHAPALVVVTTRPSTYVERYAEHDKARPGLGESSDGWPVPYWWVDAGAVVQNLLLLVVDSGLGACMFGPFDHEAALKSTFGIDDDVRLVATVAIGHRLPDEPGRSSQRGRQPIDELIDRPRVDKPPSNR